jgi:hypothetical protein
MGGMKRAWASMRVQTPTVPGAEPETIVVHPEPPPTVRRPIAARRTRLTILAVTALGVLFVGLALLLRRSPGVAVDLAITRAIQRLDGPYVTGLMIGISAPGCARLSWLILGGIVVTLLLAGFDREVLCVLATEDAGILTASIKLLVARPRPADDSMRIAGVLLDYSYPSGSAVGYTCLYGFLFFLLSVLFRQSWRRAPPSALRRHLARRVHFGTASIIVIVGRDVRSGAP